MSAKKRFTLFISTIICFSLITFFCTAQEGRIVRETVYSTSLEGNLLGDSPNRPVTIYLPPGYDTKPEMVFPVVYLLHGYTGNNELWTGGSYIGASNIVSSMKSWLNSGKVREMILVMPNSYNKFLGSHYTNSPTIGSWADYIAKDLVSYIDKKYRTLPQRESRAVIGHSMGGYGGMKLGILYPQVFGCMGGMAGLYVSEDFIKGGSVYDAIASTIENWNQFYSLDLRTRASFAMAAAFAPNPDKPPFYCDFAFVYTNTQPRQIVRNQDAYEKYLKHDINKLAEINLSTISKMKAIYIDCGTNDDVISEARILHDKLNELGIKHIYKEFSGDHTCCVMTSTGDALEVFSGAMAYEMLVNVESSGKLVTTWGQIRR